MAEFFVSPKPAGFYLPADGIRLSGSAGPVAGAWFSLGG